MYQRRTVDPSPCFPTQKVLLPQYVRRPDWTRSSNRYDCPAANVEAIAKPLSSDRLFRGEQVLRDTARLAVVSQRNELCKQVVVRTRLNPTTVKVIGPNPRKEGEATRERPHVAKYLVLAKAKVQPSLVPL